MLSCMLRILLLLVLASQSFGCKSSDIGQAEQSHPIPLREQFHHISVDEEGHARGYVQYKTQYDKEQAKFAVQADFENKEQLQDGYFQAQYVDPILNNMERYVIEQHEKKRPAQILLFIHGGLNSYEEGLGHIDKFLKAQTATEEEKRTLKFPNLNSYFLLSLNWEAGLQSALFDHFFHIRYGKRDPWFATATSPIVLFHDLGNSIIKTPDAIYSETKDLFQNQSADYTSAMITTALMASYYGLPIAALHPTLTIAGVMPYATYGAAGLYGYTTLRDDLTRYLFMPIRMASAPLVEGFGTPAWDMLKRRPDLLLFNPATKKDSATQQLLKQLADRIEDGKWQTAECKSNKSVPCPLVELTLLGHSMGAMVSDRILTTLAKQLTFKHIIYLGAANSIADFKVSVVPYLRDHKQTKFWSFALSEVDESNETYAADLLSRGSLLVWIDLLLERTYGLPQKRFGREANQGWLNIDDGDAWKSICRISFSSDRARKEEPRKHGDFTEPDKVELVLGMVKNGCPEPVKLVKAPENTMSDNEFRKDLQQKLNRVPRFTPKSIGAIVDNAPYSDKGDLDYGEFLSEQSYEEIGNYISPININVATTDELALLLRGDRYLARQIFERACQKPYASFEELREIQHLSPEAYMLIKEYGIIGDPRPISNDSWFATFNILHDLKPQDLPTCTPPDWGPYIRHQLMHWRSNVHPLDPGYKNKSRERYRKLYTADDRYRKKVIDEIKREGIAIPPVERAGIWDKLLNTKNTWDAILSIEESRIAIGIHSWADLQDRYDLEDQERNHAERLVADISVRATKSDVDAVIFVTNEDVFSKPSMAKVKEAIRSALGENFHSVYGLPKTIPDKIKAILQRYTKEHTS